MSSMFLWGYCSFSCFHIERFSGCVFMFVKASLPESLPGRGKKKEKEIESWGSDQESRVQPQFTRCKKKKKKADLFGYMYLYSPLMVHAHTWRGGRRVLKRQRKWLRWKKSILICSAVERNIRLSWEWWALRCFKRPTRYCSTFQCTLTEASGYLRCLNNSSVVDIYRAGPCMKCHHTLGGSGGP